MFPSKTTNKHKQIEAKTKPPLIEDKSSIAIAVAMQCYAAVFSFRILSSQNGLSMGFECRPGALELS
ncbi:hypothetical protein KC19_5G193600 [Ceratodon purpureus]|uniref:Uncharacterized protein n=1 Tax=Ceratodon purpureus TaxID=3225 RepID=A0A8T0I4Q2_CERPU|nr:hypothetical protein KC19_5G193600 [Ceratodon purpureus]